MDQPAPSEGRGGGGRRPGTAAGGRQEGQRRRQGGWGKREQIADGESRAPEATGTAGGVKFAWHGGEQVAQGVLKVAQGLLTRFW